MSRGVLAMGRAVGEGASGLVRRSIGLTLTHGLEAFLVLLKLKFEGIRPFLVCRGRGLKHLDDRGVPLDRRHGGAERGSGTLVVLGLLSVGGSELAAVSDEGQVLGGE